MYPPIFFIDHYSKRAPVQMHWRLSCYSHLFNLSLKQYKDSIVRMNSCPCILQLCMSAREHNWLNSLWLVCDEVLAPPTCLLTVDHYGDHSDGNDCAECSVVPEQHPHIVSIKNHTCLMLKQNVYHTSWSPLANHHSLLRHFIYFFKEAGQQRTF